MQEIAGLTVNGKKSTFLYVNPIKQCRRGTIIIKRILVMIALKLQKIYIM